MKKLERYAVITGDIIGSTSLYAYQRDHLLSLLTTTFKGIKNLLLINVYAPFEIHRGDSFQGILSNPGDALRVAIFIRANLRYGLKIEQHYFALDTRIAVGIGTIDFLPASGRASEGDGEAFHLSGPTLDKMKSYHQLLIQTPWPKINAELDVECVLLDAIINRWTREQAQAILEQIPGSTQEMIAKKLGVSQPAIQKRLKLAGGLAIEEICRRYEFLIREASNYEANNQAK